MKGISEFFNESVEMDADYGSLKTANDSTAFLVIASN